MKKLLVVIAVAAFAGFAWLSLPGFDQAQAPGARQQTVSGSGLVVGMDPAPQRGHAQDASRPEVPTTARRP
jgi:hypothetical protein